MIGLVTCFWVKNYGSALQSYATQNILDKLNMENETINYSVANEPLLRRLNIILHKLRYPSVRKAKIDKYINKKELHKSEEYEKGVKDRIQAFDSFIKDHIRFSEQIKDRKHLEEQSLKYSTIIVGSDQLWLPENIEEDYYTLTWVPKGIKKVSYATSFGVSTIPSMIRKKTREFLMEMDGISVRELSGVNIVKEISGKNAEIVLDPTLLLTRKEWDNLDKRNRMIEEKYIFCYFMAKGQKKRKFAENLKEKTGYKIIVLKHLDEFIPEDENFGDYAPYDIGPIEFINLIKYAEYVCTDSFHGTVFSIINHKDFFTFSRYEKEVQESTNTRLVSLLKLLGLENRMNNDEIMNATITNYDDVDRKLLKLRENSLTYLKDAIDWN
ncbi:polysaccharide pyruvyl transferase family protein [Clostridium sp. AF17-2]|jgi:hypothetical protein|uniref:polysaccharide pyruvyl transferase family protein n=1 Tax=unclassified Clostridium TaxID=2614128 RepID=UPI000E527952|nr:MULTISPECIES: polysaccharide pyruvyl transferase family protein [unclassified Clostridium]RGG76792.1 polysaccharide pyruvyl transferase family protein [Clostridium sp. AF17-21AC]RHR56795.1 polysaccharide pyruvyl transferase family protein [Clostridium sp. AF17-2]